MKSPITDIMHRHVVTVDAKIPARQCAGRMARERIGCIIVTQNGRPLGIITERDYVNLVVRGKPAPERARAVDIMSSPLITVAHNADFAAAVQLINQKDVKRLPVVKAGRVIGLLTLKNMMAFSNLELARLAQRNKKLATEAEADALTGLYNKAAITRQVRREYERIHRFGGRTSLLMLDLDHFKKINDTHSHLAGDAVLRELGKLLKKVCREIDTVGRFGGEEFVIIAPNRKKYHAVLFGERLRKAVEDHVFPFKNLKIRLTVSLGIASLFEGRNYKAALERADRALYHAKAMGRNRIGLWRDGKLSIAAEHRPN
jgi:diguanylate cyclase (GGDEF)-like protein